MNTPLALVVGSAIVSLGIYLSTPRYEIVPIPTSINPAVWKLDKYNGDVALCATASGKDTESGCSKKLKQF